MREELFREYLTTEIGTIGTDREMSKSYHDVIKSLYDTKPKKTGAEIANDIIQRAGLKVG